MVNHSGTNGYGKKNYPPDDVLRETLLGYARLELPQESKLNRLSNDHKLNIGISKLNQLERRLGIPSVKRSGMSRETIIQAVVDEAEKDIMENNGPNYIKSKLKNHDIKVPRDTVRSIMRQEFPNGAAKRFPGSKKVARINRQMLSALGPFHEVAGDGHEKLNAQALEMGGIGLPFYGYRDKWTGQLVTLDVVPDSRSPAAIGYLYLDLVEKLGGAPLQLNLDKGSEIGWQIAMQLVLRELCAPEIDPAVYKAIALLKSVHNIIIEALWHWLRQKSGLNLREVILQGRRERLIDVEVEYHHHLFYWIFVPLVQAELDEFRMYWNQRQVRAQANKDMPSGHVPDDAVKNPQLLGGINCLVRIPKEVVDDLRDYLSEEVGPREQFYTFYPVKFGAFATEVFTEINSPSLSLSNAWQVFTQMSDIMESRL